MSVLMINGKEYQDPRDSLAKVIAGAWTDLNSERQGFLQRGLEARRYLTATSTAHTEVGTLPWKNKTTIPKLTQISDNLKSFYMAALLPTDDWFIWEGCDYESQEKADKIEAYMRTKLRMGGFRKALEQLVSDWLVYGNCFAGVTWVREKTKSKKTGEEIVNYVGPKLYRISPIDCVIDPKAPSFEKSPFIKRSMVSIVDILEHNDSVSGPKYDTEGLSKISKLRQHPNDFTDIYKAIGYEIDGFNSFQSYLESQYVELLEYWGDIYDPETGTVHKNKVITIADRSFILRVAENPAWNGKKPFAHTGWRIVPDNLYGQGPLDNLVGMQYRCDHLENLKADAFDQVVHPIIKIKGDDVEDFEFGPGVKIQMGVESDVEFLRPDSSVLACDNQIATYHNYMELMAGSPREAMGFRTPGEKTAFEVQTLTAGADRMFQDKLMHFEEHVIETILNLMFELVVRNIDPVDVARVFNDNTNALELLKITKEDVVADGTLRPIGARHYIARNKRVQELQNFLMIAQNPAIAPHISGLNTAKMFEEELGFNKYNIVDDYAGIKEQLKGQATAQQFQQMLQKMGMLQPPQMTEEQMMQGGVGNEVAQQPVLPSANG